MKNKKVFLIIAIIVFVNLGLFVFFRFRNQTKFAPASSPSQLSQPTISGQQLADEPTIEQDLPPVDQPASTFDSDSGSGTDSSLSTVTIGGVLIGDGNPWTLIYDTPGSPATTLELVFTDQSLCDFGQGDTSCSPMYFEVGTDIEATGQKDGSRLIVSQIKRTVPLMGQ